MQRIERVSDASRFYNQFAWRRKSANAMSFVVQDALR
jgi:hypothetical protein